jgi:hypothetical protein
MEDMVLFVSENVTKTQSMFRKIWFCLTQKILRKHKLCYGRYGSVSFRKYYENTNYVMEDMVLFDSENFTKTQIVLRKIWICFIQKI